MVSFFRDIFSPRVRRTFVVYVHCFVYADNGKFCDAVCIYTF